MHWTLFCVLLALASLAHGHGCTSSADCDGFPCVHTVENGFVCMGPLPNVTLPIIKVGDACKTSGDCKDSFCIANRCMHVTMTAHDDVLAELNAIGADAQKICDRLERWMDRAQAIFDMHMQMQPLIEAFLNASEADDNDGAEE